MCYNETKRLINKYNRQYVPGERPNRSTQKEKRDTRKLLHRLETLNELENELPFTLTQNQKAEVENLIRRFNNKFKKLHGNASEKTIILAFIFYTRKLDEPKTQIGQYTVATKNGLNTNIFITIICRITEDYRKNSPINNTRMYNYNHTVLQNTNPILTNTNP